MLRRRCVQLWRVSDHVLLVLLVARRTTVSALRVSAPAPVLSVSVRYVPADYWLSRNIYKKRVAPHENPYSEYVYDSLEYTVRSRRILGSKDREEFPSSPPVTKRQKMMPGTGRPTQFHAVPFEERAPDGKGGKLPYALEYPA